MSTIAGRKACPEVAGDVRLPADQLERLRRGVVDALREAIEREAAAPVIAVGVASAARMVDVAAQVIRDEIARGNLRAFASGSSGTVRILVTDLVRWCRGQLRDGDDVVPAMRPDQVERRRARRHGHQPNVNGTCPGATS